MRSYNIVADKLRLLMVGGYALIWLGFLLALCGCATSRDPCSTWVAHIDAYESCYSNPGCHTTVYDSIEYASLVRRVEASCP